MRLVKLTTVEEINAVMGTDVVELTGLEDIKRVGTEVFVNFFSFDGSDYYATEAMIEVHNSSLLSDVDEFAEAEAIEAVDTVEVTIQTLSNRIEERVEVLTRQAFSTYTSNGRFTDLASGASISTFAQLVQLKGQAEENPYKVFYAVNKSGN